MKIISHLRSLSNDKNAASLRTYAHTLPYHSFSFFVCAFITFVQADAKQVYYSLDLVSDWKYKQVYIWFGIQITHEYCNSLHCQLSNMLLNFGIRTLPKRLHELNQSRCNLDLLLLTRKKNGETFFEMTQTRQNSFWRFSITTCV